MTSHTTERFRRAFVRLPRQVQQQAREAYALFLADPFHPRLHFKQVHPTEPIFSARIKSGYRAVGVRDGDSIIWFWIGSHADYDKLLKAGA